MARALALVLLTVLALVAPALADPAPAILAPGDRLAVEVLGESDVSQNVFVADDGTIGLPLIGQVHVAGATPTGASDAIASALKRYVRDPHVVVTVIAAGHIDVLVLGDVVNSGEYQLRPGARLSDAITAAGGMAPSIAGEYPVARIAMPNGTVDNISLEKLLRGGDPTRDIALADRAAIYVPGPTTFQVTILGAVDRPGTVTLNEGDRLSIAIAKAGHSSGSRGDLNRITVTRTEADGKSGSHVVDLYQSLEKGNTLYDPRLRKGDVVYVPIARSGQTDIGSALFVLGHLLFF